MTWGLDISRAMSNAADENLGPADAKVVIWKTRSMVAALVAFCAAAVIGIIASFFDIRIAQLVRDPAAVYRYPSYTGLFSHIGIFLMVSTAAITGFAAWTSQRLVRDGALVLGATAVLTAALVLDDVFMFHEKASRIGEALIFGFYGACGIAILVLLRVKHTDYDRRGIWIALCFMGLSVLSDATRVGGPFRFWLEDFSKLAGFAAWLTFWAGFAGSCLTTPRSLSQRE